MEKPEEYDINKDMENDPEVDENEIGNYFFIYLFLFSSKFTYECTFSDKSKYKLVCWNLNERGAVGETILHLCMLNATALHADLAKRLLRFYPKLINDIYIDDEYYGIFNFLQFPIFI